MAQARRIKTALIQAHGAQPELEGHVYPIFPDARQLLGLNLVDLEALVHNRQKTAYLADLIPAFAAVEEPWLRSAPVSEVDMWLRQLKGLGPWSASFILIRGLGRMETTIDSSDEMRRAAPCL